MNSHVLVKLLVVVVVLGNSAVLNGGDKPLITERPTIKVEWHIEEVGVGFTQFTKEVRSENKQRCAHFGLHQKDCFGFVVVSALYHDERYDGIFIKTGTTDNRKMDWVLAVPTDVTEHKVKSNKKKKKFGDILKTLVNQFDAAFTSVKSGQNLLRYTNPEIYEYMAKSLGYNPDEYDQITKECAHPRFIPAGWIVDKDIGSKMILQAHEFNVEVTIASLPKKDNDLAWLKLFSWQCYVKKHAPKALAGLLACGILGILLKYLKQ